MLKKSLVFKRPIRNKILSEGKILNFGRPGAAKNDNTSYSEIPPNEPGLVQEDYLFELVNKITGELSTFVKRGHLVLTNTNVVLMDEKSEIKWAIRNDEDLISFERLDLSETELAIIVPSDVVDEPEA